jgi:hypothetical protein
MNADRTNEAAKNLAKLAQESGKALTDTAITAQERNLAFAQSVLENGIEVLKSHAESTRTIMQELIEQARKQQVGPEGLQILMDNAVAAQERNTQFAQSVFENGVELIKSQIDLTHSLLQDLELQAQKRQATIQVLAQESLEAYREFLFAPLAFWQKAMETAGSVTQEGLKNFQNATLQGMETMQKTTQQAVAMMEKSLPHN